MSVFSELRERKVVRMAVIYAVAGWGVLQIVDIAAGVIGLPDWTLRFTLTLIILCFPLALILSWFFKLTPEGLKWESEPTQADQSVAVLPFRMQPADADDEYLAEGLTEEALQALTRVPGLRVPSRRSCFRFRDSQASLADVAARLGVRHLVEGVVTRRPDGFAVSVELIDTRTDSVVWSDSWQHSGREAPVLHADMASGIAGALGLDATAPRSSDAPGSAAAYHAWLRGRHAAHRNTADGYRAAISRFEEAIELDPDFAAAHAGLARAYIWLARYGLVTSAEGLRRARAAADRALELDPAIAAGHLALAEIRLSASRDFAGAEASLRRALELEPGSAEIHLQLGHFLAMLGRADESIAMRRHAVELDPLSEQAHLGLADSLFLAGRYAEARERLDRIRELAPDFPVAHLRARIALAENDPRKALEEIAAEPLQWRRLYIRAIALHRLGESEEAHAELSELIRIYGDEIALQAAIVHAQLGEPDEAFAWLETALARDDPGLIELQADPELEPLRADPRFPAVLRRAGFP